MRTPDAPFLEFGFYFETLALPQAFRRVTSNIASLKEVKLHKATWFVPNADNEDVGIHLCGEWIEEPIDNVPELQCFLGPEKSFLSKLTISGLADIVPERFEFIVPHTAVKDGAVVSVWSDGYWLSMGPERDSPLLRAGGAKAIPLFRSLLELLRPSYAAITADWPLESPQQLRMDPRTLAFLDFYLSKRYLSPSVLRKFANEYAAFDQEELADGRLFLSSAFLSNKKNHVDSEIAEDACQFIANTIAHT